MPHRVPSECPVCGETLLPKAKACPECGACEKSGWKNDFSADGLNLPDEEFDYDDFIEKEFGKKAVPPSIKKRWWIVAIILLILTLLMTFHG
jgi:hypothetical protein